jgi:hypothetical protein
MYANHERLDVTLICAFAVTGVGGMWGYAYFAKYSVSIADDGFTVRRFAREPAAFFWRQIASVRETKGEIRFEMTDHRKIAISMYFPGYAALSEAAARVLPDVVYASPADRPFVLPAAEQSRPEVIGARNAAVRSVWVTAWRRSAFMAAGLATAAYASDLALRYLPLRQMPDAIRIVLIWIFVVIRAFGYRFAILVAFFAILYLIMLAQHAYRVRRGLPPAT